MSTNYSERYTEIRGETLRRCANLDEKTMSSQPMADVSPPKWHLGHTTWFFETFLLRAFSPNYQTFSDHYSFLFNSYYESEGKRLARDSRGTIDALTKDIIAYRQAVDELMIALIPTLPDNALAVLEIGLQHEQQHQELLLYDIKYIGHRHNIDTGIEVAKHYLTQDDNLSFKGGLCEIGSHGTSFCYDNELPRHKVFLSPFKLNDRLVSNGEYKEFINDGGYKDFRLWHSDGFNFVKSNQIDKPLYWTNEGEVYTLRGNAVVDPLAPVAHISFYEAFAFATWAGKRLPTESEWEIASGSVSWGNLWEWSASAYLPYPGYKAPEGALGEYNGKFMVNQHVLRGASIATPKGHKRSTYRNFFYPHQRWMFSGLRLAE